MGQRRSSSFIDYLQLLHPTQFTNYQHTIYGQVNFSPPTFFFREGGRGIGVFSFLYPSEKSNEVRESMVLFQKFILLQIIIYSVKFILYYLTVTQKFYYLSKILIFTIFLSFGV